MVPGDQRPTTEFTDTHRKENSDQPCFSVSFRVFRGYPLVTISLAGVIWADHFAWADDPAFHILGLDPIGRATVSRLLPAFAPSAGQVLPHGSMPPGQTASDLRVLRGLENQVGDAAEDRLVMEYSGILLSFFHSGSLTNFAPGPALVTTGEKTAEG